MKIKEVRLLSSYNLRNLCIKNHWYTKGTNSEYSYLLQDLTHFGRENMTTEDIEAVARDIMEHSVMDEEQDVCSVMWSVNEVCNTVFVRV